MTDDAPENHGQDGSRAEMGPREVDAPPVCSGVDAWKQRVRGWLPIALALTSVLAVQALSLDGGFFWDDESLIVDNPAVRQGAGLADWFVKSFWPPGLLQSETGGLYRPLTLLSYRLDWMVHAENATGFHATNVLLHTCNTLLMYVVATRLGATRVAAAIAATMWAMLPRLTECSAWISGRTDMLALGFVLASFALWPWTHGGTEKREGTGRVLLACGMLLMGLLSKEVAAAGLLSLLVLEIRQIFERGAGAGFSRIALLCGTGAVYLALRIVALGANQTPSGTSQPFVWKLGRAFAAAGTYLVMLLTPWKPQARIGLAWRYEAAPVVLGAVFAALVLAMCVFVWRGRNRALTALCVLGVTALLAVVHLIPLPSNVLASDRFLYFPTAAAALGCGVLAARITARWRLAVAALALLATVGLGAITVRRIAMWNEPVVFWIDTCASADPANFMPGAQLGVLLDQAGYSEEAIAFHRNALGRLAPPDGNVRLVTANLAESFARKGQHDRAAAAWLEVTRLDPSLPHAWMRLGRMEAWQRDWKPAREHTVRALQLAPDDPMIRRQLESLRAWEQVEAELPDVAAAQGDPELMLRRARMLAMLGKVAEAEHAWRAVLQRETGGAAFHEGMLFYAQMAEPRHARTALSILARAGESSAASSAIRATLTAKAEEAARIESHREGIETCLRRSVNSPP